MFKILVRAKKDADAVRAALNVFYRDWNISVETLGGVRSKEDFYSAIMEKIDQKAYNLVIVGREDYDKLMLEPNLPWNTYIQPIPRQKVRNARLPMIKNAIERGKAKIRTTIYWRESYILGKGNGLKLDVENHPAYDPFLLWGVHSLAMLSNYIGEVGGVALLVRKMGGEHDVYIGPKLVAKLKIPDHGLPRGERLSPQYEETSPDALAVANQELLSRMEELSISLIKDVGKDYDTVIVPWSGGRDSTATLLLTLKALGRRVKAIYVDMGLEFNITRRYVEEVAKNLRVDLEIAKVDLLHHVREKGLPSHRDRWCTKLKINALYSKIREISSGKTLIIVGDRDAESELRSKRPFIRRHEEFIQVAPIKLWSAAHAQVYLLINKVPLNPLYMLGFYRIGCWICPSLRGWEKEIMRKHLMEELKDAGEDILKKVLETV